MAVGVITLIAGIAAGGGAASAAQAPGAARRGSARGECRDAAPPARNGPPRARADRL